MNSCIGDIFRIWIHLTRGLNPRDSATRATVPPTRQCHSGGGGGGGGGVMNMGGFTWGSAVMVAAPPLAALLCCVGLTHQRGDHYTDDPAATQAGEPVVDVHSPVQEGGSTLAVATESVATSRQDEVKPPPFRPMSSGKVAQLVEWHSVASLDAPSEDLHSRNFNCSDMRRRVNVGSEGSTPKQIRVIGDNLADIPVAQHRQRDPPPLELEPSALHATHCPRSAANMSMNVGVRAEDFVSRTGLQPPQPQPL